jgi:hypothetical protein
MLLLFKNEKSVAIKVAPINKNGKYIIFVLFMVPSILFSINIS